MFDYNNSFCLGNENLWPRYGVPIIILNQKFELCCYDDLRNKRHSMGCLFRFLVVARTPNKFGVRIAGGNSLFTWEPYTVNLFAKP